jgi:hypothetical protein
MSPFRGFKLTARYLLRLLLEAVEKNDPAPGEEEVDDPIDVRIAFFSELPQIAVEMPSEWRSRLFGGRAWRKSPAAQPLTR